MKKIISLIWMVLVVVAAHAQDSTAVKKDPRLEVLTAKQVAMNKRQSMMTSNGQYKGFRVQVLSTTDRTKAFDIKAQLLTRFPAEKSYALFQSPYFKIRIGNFIKKEDAETFRKQLAKMFPDGCFVVQDVIEYTPPEEEAEIIE